MFVAGAALVFLVVPWLGARGGAGVIAGTALGASNLWLIAKVVRAMVGAPSPQAASGWPLVAVPKLCLLAAAVWYILRGGTVTVLPFVIGVGAVPLGIVGAQLLSLPEVPAGAARDDA